MSAETLRRAAALMRERAEAATPGPWHHFETTEHIGQGFCGKHPCEPSLCGMSVVYLNGGQVETPNAEHIASWHPAVALAVANWLDVEARRLHRLEVDGIFNTYQANTSRALAVARAYLGEFPNPEEKP